MIDDLKKEISRFHHGGCNDQYQSGNCKCKELLDTIIERVWEASAQSMVEAMDSVEFEVYKKGQKSTAEEIIGIIKNFDDVSETKWIVEKIKEKYF